MKNNFIDNEEKKQMEIWNDVDVAKFESDTENIKQLKSIAKNVTKYFEKIELIRHAWSCFLKHRGCLYQIPHRGNRRLLVLIGFSLVFH